MFVVSKKYLVNNTNETNSLVVSVCNALWLNALYFLVDSFINFYHLITVWILHVWSQINYLLEISFSDRNSLCTNRYTFYSGIVRIYQSAQPTICGKLIISVTMDQFSNNPTRPRDLRTDVKQNTQDTLELKKLMRSLPPLSLSLSLSLAIYVCVCMYTCIYYYTLFVTHKMWRYKIVAADLTSIDRLYTNFNIESLPIIRSSFWIKYELLGMMIKRR